MKLRTAILSRIILTAIFMLTVFLFSGCSESNQKYPESLKEAIDLFYAENKNDSVLLKLDDLKLTRQPKHIQQLKTIFTAAAICEKGDPQSAKTILQKIKPGKTDKKTLYYFKSISSLIEFRCFNPEKAYIQLLKLTTEKTPDIRALALNQRLLGRIMFNYTDYESALNWFQLSLRNYEKAGLTKGMGVNNKFIGNICVNIALYNEASKYLNTAESIFKKFDDKAELFYVYVVINDLYIRQNKLDSAGFYIDKAVMMNESSEDKTMQSHIYNNFGEIAKLKAKYPEAIEMFNKTLGLGVNYYNSLQMRRFAYLNLSGIYNRMGQPDKAKEYALSALNSIVGDRSNDTKSAIYFELAKSYTSTDSHLSHLYLDSAMNYLEKFYTSKSVNLINFFNSQQQLYESQEKIQDLNTKNKAKTSIAIIVSVFLFLIIIALSRISEIRKARNVALTELVKKNLRLLEEQRKYNEEQVEKNKSIKRRLKNPSDEEHSKIIYSDFVNWLVKEGNFKRNDITLESTAKELNTNREYLSRAISDQNERFSDIINKYRIQEVIRIFSTPEDPRNKLNLKVIASEVGYNSNSVFIESFRKLTGMTPTQFKEHSHSIYN